MNVYCAAGILMLAGAMQPDQEAIRNGLIARLDGLQRIVVKFDLEWIPSPPKRFLKMDGKDKGDGFINVCKDPVMTHEEFWYLDGRMRHESRLSVESREYLGRINSKYQPDAETINVYTSQKYEYLYRRKPTASYRGEIDNIALQMSIDREIELGLGLKSMRSNKWMSESDFDNAKIETMETGDVVVSMDIRGQLHKWTYKPNLGYAVESYEIFIDNELGWRYTNSDFKNVDGFMLPMKMENRAFNEEDGETIVVDTKRITVHEYGLKHPENTPEKYHIVWPAGASVYDHRIGVRFEADETGKLYPDVPIGSKEILDNIEKLPLETEDASDANGKLPANVTTKAAQDPNANVNQQELPAPIASAEDADFGSGRTVTIVALALFLVCAVSVVIYNAKRRGKATGSNPQIPQ